MFNLHALSLLVFTSISSVAISHDFTPVKKEIKLIEDNLSAHIGVAVLNTKTGEHWHYKGNERVPLTSTFKTIACAKLLHDADSDKSLLSRTVLIKSDELVTYSPITEKHVGQEITLKDACAATMHTSDNTAANIIINAVAGTEGITDFIRKTGDDVTRLDRFEPELNEALLNDIRDTTTPNAITKTINRLLFGSVLSRPSQQQLKEWMVNNQVTGNLLRSVLPKGWEIADRSGAGGFGTRSITAVVWGETQSPLIISIYIAQTEASFSERNEAIIKIGQSIFNSYHSNN
ncbi:class A beta-lactamase [Cellvibrio fibrivorans]|uniref:class A beta-lactamase n=1 Tax=Cellvibrio fibrivorans TaxID=126350 RepID=UPI0035B542DD